MTHVSPDILDPDPAVRQQGYVRVSEAGRQVFEQQAMIRPGADHAAEVMQDSEEAEVEPINRVRGRHDRLQHGLAEHPE